MTARVRQSKQPVAYPRRARRLRLAPVARYALLVIAVIISIAPVYWMVTISLKTEIEQMSPSPEWINFTPTFVHYQSALFGRSFGQYFITSATVAALSTTCAMVVGTLAAYGLARFELRARLNRRLSMWILSTRMLPPILSAVPLFLMMRDLSLLDTLASLVIVYMAMNLPFVVWMMRGFFQELPREMEEAAMVDGDTRMGALRRVIIPLVAPGLAATAVFCLIASWNEFLFALVLTQTDAAATLPVGIAGLVTQYEIKWGIMSAAGIMAMIPILVFAIAVQRYLVRGLSLGAVKG
ncbi:MAG TPA: carbohydrate ABC transporter permease [Blastocatellia bacterium]|nr:carbohydrate ABC transporter permease [Blastocatellia bacterium]